MQAPGKAALPADLRLPLSVLIRYTSFLARRPTSASNTHFLQQRLAGLRSLAALLAEFDEPGLERVLAHLRAMSPATLRWRAEAVQLALLPFVPTLLEIPPDFVISERPPRGDFFAGVERILFVLGPAIGIGDECILFSLPARLKAASSGAEITVLSAYEGLWDRVRAVDRTLHYSDHRRLTEALRGVGEFAGFDVVVFADFERPDLHQAMCWEAGVQRYVELSLGGQTLSVVDGRHRWLHHVRRPAPYFANYYFGLAYVLRWWGLTATGDGILDCEKRRPEGGVEFYVNPFTAKYDPSPLYWSRLLSALYPEEPRQPVRMVVDAGTNPATEHFASTLVRSLAGRMPRGVSMDVRKQPGTPTFEGVFSELGRCQVVICADSFLAHLAPLFGCTTLVLARPGLEKWRAPYAGSYYFSADDSLEEVSAGLRQVLRACAGEPDASAPVERPERVLAEASSRLGCVLTAPAADGLLGQSYGEFVDAYRAVIERLSGWSPAFQSIIKDADYDTAWCGTDGVSAVPANLAPDFRLHAQDRWEQWQSTNLCKYLRMATAGRA